MSEILRAIIKLNCRWHGKALRSVVMIGLILFQSLGALGAAHHPEHGSGEQDDCCVADEHIMVFGRGDAPPSDAIPHPPGAASHKKSHPCHLFSCTHVILSKSNLTLTLADVTLAAPTGLCEAAKDGCKASLFRPPRLA